MKRVLITLILLLFAGSAWGATYYVDKRCTYNGNGTAATCAASAGAAGAWNSPSVPLQTANVSASTHTVNVVAGSGPYLTTDFTFLSLGYWYPQQGAGANITWNWNGNTVQMDVDINTSAYSWTQSTSAGLTSFYYLRTSGGANPSLTQPKCAVVNGYWSAATTNLNNPPYISPGQSFTLYGHYLTDNWLWGDYDSLGYNTLYVRYNNGQNPTGGNPIYIPQKDYVLNVASSTAVFNHVGGIFRGANVDIGYILAKTNFNKCKFMYSDSAGLDFRHANAANSAITNSIFIGAGHRSIDVIAAVPLTVYNNTFIDGHLALRMYYNGTYTIVFKNNATKNLLAGAIQHDNAAATLTEDHNQFHIDPNTTHGGAAISFTGASRQWTTTAATDLPASTATTATTGTNCLLNTFGRPLPFSPCRNTGTDVGLTTDFDGKAYGSTFPMGAYKALPPNSGGGFSGYGFGF